MTATLFYPDPHNLPAPTAAESRHDMAEIDNLLARSSANYPDHRAARARARARVAPRRTDRTLQVYFW